MNEYNYPVGDILTNYFRDICDDINSGYEAGRTLAFNIRRLKEKERNSFVLDYSYILLNDLRKDNLSASQKMGLWAYKFLHHFDCRIIDQAVREAQEYFEEDPIVPWIAESHSRMSGIESLLEMAQKAAGKVNQQAEQSGKPKIEITTYPDWMY